jgi:hypothetical protein
MTGRSESIISYREQASGRVLTRRCYGKGVAAQIADGLRQLPEGDWQVQSRSTPGSILRDLKGRA